MSTEKLDYSLVLADLEAKRSALDAAILNLRLFLAGQYGDSGFSAAPATTGSAGEVPAGAFLGKSIPEAAKLYLQIVKRKATTREITEALREGGMESTSDNFQGIVHAVINRYRKAGGDIVKLERSTWGLAEWYPAGVRATAQEKRPKKKARRKTKAASGPKPVAKVEVKATPANKVGSEALIQSAFDSNPDTEYSSSELASGLGIHVGAVNLVCAKLAHRGKLEKTSTGKYRAAKLHAMPRAV
jgi:hypothetical protein